MAGPTKTGKTAITTAERRAIAMELRRKGRTYDYIATELEITRSGAFKLVTTGLAKLVEQAREDAEIVIQIELDRLDAMFAEAYRLATATPPNFHAIDRCIKIMERRSKLLGLDSPEKIEVDAAIKGYTKVSPDDWDEGSDDGSD